MLSDRHVKALRTLSERLKGITWVLIGSTNLAMQGVDVEPHDIDILTDQADAEKIGWVLEDCAIERVHLKTGEAFDSYYGKFLVDGIRVEVMGDLKNKKPDADLWGERSNFSKKVWFTYKGLVLPVMPLEQEERAYRAMGREGKAELIADVLRKARRLQE